MAGDGPVGDPPEGAAPHKLEHLEIGFSPAPLPALDRPAAFSIDPPKAAIRALSVPRQKRWVKAYTLGMIRSSPLRDPSQVAELG
jgi:hypothetical protein